MPYMLPPYQLAVTLQPMLERVGACQPQAGFESREPKRSIRLLTRRLPASHDGVNQSRVSFVATFFVVRQPRSTDASKERVEWLMLANDIRDRHKRRFKATTDSKHALPVAPNLLNRNFTPTAPNQVWTACQRPAYWGQFRIGV